MALFYFDSEDGELHPDVSGEDLPDIQSARCHAAKLLHDVVASGRAIMVDGCHIHVADEAGNRLYTLGISPPRSASRLASRDDWQQPFVNPHMPGSPLNR